MGGPIFLCGMMGSGKTSVGEALAEALDCPLVDLDARIERIYGVTIPVLFEESEARFRECERDALASLVAEPAFVRRRVVVATGGGAIVRRSNRRIMDMAGVRVLLDVPIDALVERLSTRAQIQARPLLTGDQALRERLRSLWRDREDAYREGALVVDGRGQVSEVSARVLAALDLAPQNGETASD